MLSFKRIFLTSQQALDVYKKQLSCGMVYVESFEAYPAGTEAKVELQNKDNRQSISLNARVERTIGKAEAMEKSFGQRPGIILQIDNSSAMMDSLRAFVGENASADSPSVRPKESTPVRPKMVEPVRPKVSEPKDTSIPLENLDTLSTDASIAAVDRYLSIASNGSLFQFFNVRSDADRSLLRSVYNKLVRTLHPDRHDSEFTQLLMYKLEEAYQMVNEAYEILQNPIKNGIYLEVSRANRMPSGMSLNDYKKFLTDYRLKNANNISLADELVKKAEESLASGKTDIAEQNINLALKYDPYHEGARSINLK